MKLKLCLSIAMTALLVVACRHKEKKDIADSVARVGDTAVVAADTSQQREADTVVVEPGAQVYNVKQDSAEITNLRLLTRKQRTIYSPSLLVGEWSRGTEHEVYLADGTGRMWDEADDVARNEAQNFEWTLDSNLLTIICKLELGGVLPKRYVVTFADDESLAYKDLYGNAYLWDKKER